MLPSLVDASGRAERTCFLRQQMRELIKNTGMLCLSAAIGSPAMWSHYADRHRGVAFEFEFPEPIPSTLSKVSYSTERVAIPTEGKGLSDRETFRQFGESLISRKASCWGCEEEYRWVFPLRQDIVYGDEPGVFSLGLPKEWKRVILGVDCVLNEAALQMALGRHSEFSDVRISRTKLDDKSFLVRIDA